MIGTGVLKFVAFAVFLFFAAALFRAIIRAHTGASFETKSAYAEEKDLQIKKRLSTLLNVTLAAGILACVGGIVRTVFRAFTDNMLVSYSELAGTVLFAGVFIWFLSKLQEGIDNKYYIDV